MLGIFRKTRVFTALAVLSIQPGFALAFSAGVRASGGLEFNTVTAPKLVSTDGTVLTQTNETSRNFLFYGADLVVTPVTFGKMSVSALLGVRMTSSQTSGDFNDELSLMYLPIGASFDYLLGSLRFSGLASFDLGMSPKLKINVPSTGDSLAPKLASLSRIRFGALGEYYITPSLSVFAQADYGLGSYKNEAGEKEIRVGGGENAEVTALLSANDNKLRGLTFGTGVAFYFPPPKSGSASTSTRPASGKKPAKGGGGKRPAAKPRPKPKAPSSDSGSKL